MSERDYLRLVRNLLAKAESTTHPGEAEALLAKAGELMAEHSIDAAMLAERQRQRDTVEHRVIICEAPYATGKWHLLVGIAEANDCRSVRVSQPGANNVVFVFGYAVDLDHVELLYTSLSLQATNELFAQPQTARSFRHSFMVSFAARVGSRLAEARAQAQRDYERGHQETGGGVALVLAGRRDAVENAAQTAFPDTRKRRTTVRSADGLAAGCRAGDRADIGQSQVGSRREIPRTS